MIEFVCFWVGLLCVIFFVEFGNEIKNGISKMFKKLIIRIKIFLGKHRRYGKRGLLDGTFSLRTGKYGNKLARWKVFYGISYEENDDKHYGEYETFGWNFYQTSNCERPSMNDSNHPQNPFNYRYSAETNPQLVRSRTDVSVSNQEIADRLILLLNNREMVLKKFKALDMYPAYDFYANAVGLAVTVENHWKRSGVEYFDIFVPYNFEPFNPIIKEICHINDDINGTEKLVVGNEEIDI